MKRPAHCRCRCYSVAGVQLPCCVPPLLVCQVLHSSRQQLPVWSGVQQERLGLRRVNGKLWCVLQPPS